VTPDRLLLLSFAVFSVGIFGLLARRHAIAVLLSLELMFNAANLAVLSVAWGTGKVEGVVVVLFGIAVTVAEVAVGLALFLLADRVRRTSTLDDLASLGG
jgi:NADH-quinone oxidoreductase subunit K